LHHIFSYCQETIKAPVLFKIGSDNDGQVLKLVVIVAVLNNDNQEAYSLCGLNIKSGKRCRLCEISKNVMNTTVSGFQSDKFRNSSEVLHLLHTHQRHFMEFLTAPRNTRLSRDYVIGRDQLKNLGILQGMNPLFQTFEWLNHHYRT
jgi:hypothetical protein